MSVYGSYGSAAWYKPHMQNKKVNKKPMIIIVISLILVTVLSCFLMTKYPVFDFKRSNVFLGIMLSLNTLLTIGIMTKVICQYSSNNTKKHKTAICIVPALMIPSFLLIYFLLPKYMVSGIILLGIYSLLIIILGAIAILEGEKGWMFFSFLILLICAFAVVLFGINVDNKNNKSLKQTQISQNMSMAEPQNTESSNKTAENKQVSSETKKESTNAIKNSQSGEKPQPVSGTTVVENSKNGAATTSKKNDVVSSSVSTSSETPQTKTQQPAESTLPEPGIKMPEDPTESGQKAIYIDRPDFGRPDRPYFEGDASDVVTGNKSYYENDDASFAAQVALGK